VPTPQQLREDAIAIWRAGLAGVQSDVLIREHVVAESDALIIGDTPLPYSEFDRIFVVGGGKAGAGMATGLEAALGEKLSREKHLSGSIAVPADCVRELDEEFKPENSFLETYAAREAGVNEPSEAGVAGARAMLQQVAGMNSRDVCICLLSGGGSALLPCPAPSIGNKAITLQDKQEVARFLSAAGADIHELNTVRKQLSEFKGGGLARACQAGWLFTLIISDVIGDQLDTIASGPTVANATAAEDALAVLKKFSAREAGLSSAVFDYLETKRKQPSRSTTNSTFRSRVKNIVIGNNAVAVDAAGMEAERRGYDHAMLAGEVKQPTANEAGAHLARVARMMRTSKGPNCLITGGEPTVSLAPEQERGRGGRNQQLALAALVAEFETETLEGVVILSGGTDGEDGPTDATGGIVSASTISEANRLGLDPADYLQRNDAYPFLDQTGGLFKTGPTHTNVCDLRVVVVDRESRERHP